MEIMSSKREVAQIGTWSSTVDKQKAAFSQKRELKFEGVSTGF